MVELKSTIKLDDEFYGRMADTLIKNNAFKTTKRDILIKDLKLTLTLSKLFSNEWISENLVFKGGTCLTKYYLNYYRYSEDIDLLSTIKENIPKQKNQFETILNEIAKENDLEIRKNNKSETNYYIQYGLTPKNSPLNEIKISVSFNEIIFYPFKEVNNYVKGLNDLEDPSTKEFTKLINCPKFKIYDEKEILLEKYRCILTRNINEKNKGRDLLDLFMIEQQTTINEKELIRQVSEKIIRGNQNKFRTKYNKNSIDLSQTLNELILKAKNEKTLLFMEDLDFQKINEYAENILKPKLIKITATLSD